MNAHPLWVGVARHLLTAGFADFLQVTGVVH